MLAVVYPSMPHRSLCVLYFSRALKIFGFIIMKPVKWLLFTKIATVSRIWTLLKTNLIVHWLFVGRDVRCSTTSPAAEVWPGSGGQGLATAAICRAIRVTEGRRGEWFTSAGLQTAGIAYRRGRRGMRAVAGSCGCKHCSTHSAGYTTHHISSRSWCEQGRVITNTLWAVYTIGLTFQNITQVLMYWIILFKNIAHII